MQTDHLDLLVRHARLVDGRVVDLAVEEGRYAAIADAGSIPTAGADAVVEAQGRLVTESFVNAHLHLDKVYTLQRAGDEALAAYTRGDSASAARAVELARQVKTDYDQRWILPNVRRVLQEALRYGTLHLRAFVDVDTTGGLEGMHAVLTAREEFRGLLDVQVVAFPQDGLIRDDGASALCADAVRLGADVVGGIPWIEETEADARTHVETACGLAARSELPVAMLVDDAADARLHTTAMLATAMLQNGLVGNGTACHARATALYSEPKLQELIELAARAGLGFVSDPHTGSVHLPVDRFLRAGLSVALGQDDIEDAYYPFGRNNMLEVAFLAAHALGFLAEEDRVRLLRMVTTGAAAVLGMTPHQIAEGNKADLCVHHDERLVDVLRRHTAPRWVVRAGEVLVESECSSRFRRGSGPTSSGAG